MNINQTLNSKLNIDIIPLKAIKVIDFLFFLIDITAAGYYYLPAIALKAAAAFWPTSDLSLY